MMLTAFVTSVIELSFKKIFKLKTKHDLHVCLSVVRELIHIGPMLFKKISLYQRHCSFNNDLSIISWSNKCLNILWTLYNSLDKEQCIFLGQ